MEWLPQSAWIYWNPNPDVFVLPYLNHPLKWYGLLFALGFILGFLILIPILRQKLLETKSFKLRDIANWGNLVQALQPALKDLNNPLNTILQNIPKQELQYILHSQDLSEISKTTLLTALSKSISGPQAALSRKQIETLLPRAIHPVSEICYKYIDQLVWFIVLGTIIGARLGHVFFYEWSSYKNNLIDIFKVWEGGLASHGGTLGVLLAVFLYVKWTREKFPEMTFISLCDLLTIPTAFAVIFIRLGNFVNQEILGTPTNLPWAILFGHPADGSLPMPRHPAQLYEGLAYFFTFLILLTIWKYKEKKPGPGFMTGLFFLLVFGSRFFIEFLKESQNGILDETFLQTGQVLSIPFMLGGLLLGLKFK